MKRLKHALMFLALVAISLAAACGVGGTVANNDATKDHTATTEPSAEGPATTHGETTSTSVASPQAPTRKDAPTYEIEVFRGTQVFFPQRWGAVRTGPLAEYKGKLVLDDNGCIRLKPLPKYPGPPPPKNYLGEVLLWPAAYELEVAGGEILILNEKGRVAAKVGGEEVIMGGGGLGSSLEGYHKLLDERTKRELYERCPSRDYTYVTGPVQIRQPRAKLSRKPYSPNSEKGCSRKLKNSSGIHRRSLWWLLQYEETMVRK